MNSTGDPKVLWICPKCGARPITRNLWHSCGKFTLDDLFAHASSEALALARRYVDMLHSLGDVQVSLVCVARVRFAGLTPRKHGLRAAFALRRWVHSPRIVTTADDGPRWRGHFVNVQTESDLDDELRLGFRSPTTR